MIRVTLPFHLRNLAGIDGEITIAVGALDAPTVAGVLNALETRFPMLRGTIRDHVTGKRRPFIRFFADGHDLSNVPCEQATLPETIATGQEPLMIVGAIAGG